MASSSVRDRAGKAPNIELCTLATGSLLAKDIPTAYRPYREHPAQLGCFADDLQEKLDTWKALDEKDSQQPSVGSDCRGRNTGLVANQRNTRPIAPAKPIGWGRPFQTGLARIAGKQIRPDGHAVGYDSTRGLPEQPERRSEQGSRTARRQIGANGEPS
jgi:hypothetical protein